MKTFCPQIYTTNVGMHRLLHDIPRFLFLFLVELFLIFNQMLSIGPFSRRINQKFSCNPGLQIRVHTGKLFPFFLNQNICCGYSKEPSQWDGSFEHPKHMFKLMGNEVNAIFGAQTILIWTYDSLCHRIFLSYSLQSNQLTLHDFYFLVQWHPQIFTWPLC